MVTHFTSPRIRNTASSIAQGGSQIQTEAVAIFLVIFGVHINIFFLVIKVEILTLVNWLCRFPLSCLLTIYERMVDVFRAHSPVLFVGHRLCIDFYVSRANLLTTLRSHLDITSSCYFWSSLLIPWTTDQLIQLLVE